MTKKIEFSEAQLQEIRRRRANGDSQAAIAGDYGCSVATISKLLRDGRRVNRKIRRNDRDDIRRRYLAGESGRAIAARYGVHHSLIYRICGGQDEAREARASKSGKVKVRCLRCDRGFETRLAGRCPMKRLCPACTAYNEQTFGGAMA
jgi:DNA invertase Pin-like site-specific DNA recombinase